MSVQDQIGDYISGQPKTKGEDLAELHRLIVGISPGCRLWFLDGRNADGKVVSNPNIGYGSRAHRYADGRIEDFYRVGMSANTGGISVYVMGLDDKAYLAETYGGRLGKAQVTGYCIKFRRLSDIDLGVLQEAIAEALAER